MLGAAKGRELAFELGDLGAHDVFAVAHDLEDRLFHARADAAALGAEIDELDRRLRQVGVGHQAISSRRSGAVSR